MAVDAEGQVAQNLGAEPIAQADIFEPDHAVLRKPLRARQGPGRRARPTGLIRPVRA